ncbi:MAG TPA: hypothetical protein VL651_13495 [Bacteroidia bacterium]|jgi:hypothetical protein|nr:hypothetical protein [Bacteroidia bacterium]
MKFCLLLVFLSLGIKALSQSDTTKWDPSDPNCPCHKLANQADLEWQQMQAQQLSNMNNNTVALNNNVVNANVVTTVYDVDVNTNEVTTNNSNAVVTNGGGSSNQIQVADTATAVQQHYSVASGGSSYYHYSALQMKWKATCKAMVNFRKRLGSRHSGTRRRKFRVAECFEFN